MGPDLKGLAGYVGHSTEPCANTRGRGGGEGGRQEIFVESGKETLKDKEPLLIGCHSTAASIGQE